ncbi:MAG: 7-carboxy-7-deazaguanine synthase QueE [Roseibium sp.]|uniref:7-carboxy-7-deazaguanine synthase QueE n=1 Tax=Roseibium sp. TaxID=1936156 RepID=UPI00260CBDEB|nr:7-carboxy-7-deazaguanine synthase QueE [Roseibium sp.]MCV0427255.1 7-carboxy-7-deazaguanine synthase QueE [Roseibium sp.]
MTPAPIRVNEIFGPTIQGEGALIGQPTVFVRTGGCDYRCTWCDTLHAVDSAYRDEWHPMTPQAIMMQVDLLSGGKALTVSLSGGNPAIQPLGDLIDLGRRKGYRFALETQGSLAKDWFETLDILTLSPKPPSSGMETDWQKLAECVAAAGPDTKTVMKVVIFDDADYAYAREVAARYPELQLYLQPGNHTPPQPGEEDGGIDMAGIMDRMRWLVDKVTTDRLYTATVLPQLHTLIWGNLRGV